MCYLFYDSPPQINKKLNQGHIAAAVAVITLRSPSKSKHSVVVGLIPDRARLHASVARYLERNLGCSAKATQDEETQDEDQLMPPVQRRLLSTEMKRALLCLADDDITDYHDP